MITNTKVCSTAACSFGRPWSFSSSALLSYDDRAFLWRMLECRFCRLRQVYNKLAVEELSSDDKELLPTSLLPRRHFHQLSRLIKAVLAAIKLQIKGGTRKKNCSRGSSAEHRPWICSFHSRDLFQYIFYAEEDCAIRKSESWHAKWPVNIFPPGKSLFFNSAAYKETKNQYISESSHKAIHARNQWKDCMTAFPLVSNGSISFNYTAILENLNIDSFPLGDRSIILDDVNRRWNETYESKNEKREYKKTKSVHFPEYPRLATVRRLVTYESACRIERADRTWQHLSLVDLLESERSNQINNSLEPCYEVSSHIFDDSEFFNAEIKISLSCADTSKANVSKNGIESPVLINTQCAPKIRSPLRRTRRRRRNGIEELIGSVIPSMSKNSTYINFAVCTSPTNFYSDRNCSCNILY